MKYRKLGNTDIDVSVICLGSMTWGEQNTEQEGHEQLDYALSQGVNFIDTAEIYSVPVRPETYGHTEQIIGSWIKKRGKRSDFVLASKVVGPGPFTSHVRQGPNYSRTQIREAIEGSLRRLQTDYIDIYQLHWPERPTNFFGQLGYKHKSEAIGTDFEEILRAMKELVDEGKIRYVGLSNETPWGFSQYLHLADKLDLPRVVSVQNPYSLINRTYEIGMSELSIRERSGLLAYSPLAGGLLSGKYLNNQKPEGARFTLFPDFMERYHNENAQLATEAYCALANELDLTPTQLALAFVNQQKFVTANIIGATSMNQLKENIGSIDIELSDDALQRIEKIHLKYPNPGP